jgi:hypothetical protein
VATTSGIASACGYAQVRLRSGERPQGRSTFDRDACDNTCVAQAVDPTCNNFNPSSSSA